MTAALVASIAIDHFGLLRVEPHPVTAARLLGAALMAAGVVLISKF